MCTCCGCVLCPNSSRSHLPVRLFTYPCRIEWKRLPVAPKSQCKKRFSSQLSKAAAPHAYVYAYIYHFRTCEPAIATHLH